MFRSIKHIVGTIITTYALVQAARGWYYLISDTAEVVREKLDQAK